MPTEVRFAFVIFWMQMAQRGILMKQTKQVIAWKTHLLPAGGLRCHAVQELLPTRLLLSHWHFLKPVILSKDQDPV